jgi:hypothetical protein
MFTSTKHYIIVGNNSFIIRKQGETDQHIITFDSTIPGVPFYHHLFDKGKPYIVEAQQRIWELKVKNVTLLAPDDTTDIQADQLMLKEFFMTSTVKKIDIDFQCFFLNRNEQKYISISKTTRTLVFQYIVNHNSIVKKYFDRNYNDIDQIKSAIKSLHPDCEYNRIPIYVNNVNDEMNRFKEIGNLVSLNDIFINLML